MEYLTDILIVASVLLLGLSIFFFVSWKNTEKKLEVANRVRDNYTQITKESNDALFVIDIADGKIHEANKKAAEILGYTEGTLRTLSIYDIHPEDKLQESADAITETWEKGGLVYQHLPYMSKEGELIQMESSAKVMPYDGRPAITIYARDIRERLRLQAEILEKSKIIEQKNKDLTDSIVYARRIQRAILPDKENIYRAFEDSFVYYNPKDIVSGDFYWYGHSEGTDFLTIADCTGHGVPGAFMSMLGSTLLKEIVETRKIHEPGKILEELHLLVRSTLKQDREGSSQNDGMDLSLIAYNHETHELQFAGANNSLYHFVREQATGEYSFQEYKADRKAIGGSQDEARRTFQNYKVPINKGDIVYMTTDGFVDQFGGKRGRKYMVKKFKRFLGEIVQHPMQQQYEELEREFHEWKGEYHQLDDVLVGGVKFS